jgi:hypothetical protein
MANAVIASAALLLQLESTATAGLLLLLLQSCF